MLSVSSDWTKSYPGAHVGILLMDEVANPDHHPELARRKAELEADLRALFKDQQDLKAIEPIRSYQQFYKRFKKTYHVMHQLQSVVFKGKPIQSVTALVEAMFMAELRNMLLTAGHDMAYVREPLRLDVAKGEESFTRINGEVQVLKPGDMYITDAEGIISSVLCGPDKRTMIRSSTRTVLFAVYAVAGVGRRALHQHLEGIEANVRIVTPNARTQRMEIFGES
ncbi:MAG: phenylalanine--tRNA ligase beta subunit-related protein [Thermodesulfobacteriota bacterium]